MLKNRIILFDILRGFAMLGVVLINFYEMNFLPTEQDDLFHNDLFSKLIELTFFNRSYLIFAFLFGCSLFLISKNKLNNKYSQKLINTIIEQRLKTILLFGIIQTIFIWWGTILIIYAIYGYFVYCISKFLSNKIQNILFVSILIFLPLIMNHFSKFDNIIINITWFPSLKMLYSYYSNYNPVGIIKLNLLAWIAEYFKLYNHTNIGNIKQAIIYQCQILGLIGVGYQTAKHNVLIILTPTLNIFILGIVILLYLLITHYEYDVNLNEWFLKNLLFSTGALLTITLITKIKYLRWFLLPFAIIGQYSYSVYVLHMLTSYVIFYVFGFYQKTSFYQQEYLAILTYYVLFVVSYYLYKIQKSGPMEVLLHKFTYLKIKN